MTRLPFLLLHMEGICVVITCLYIPTLTQMAVGSINAHEPSTSVTR